MNRRPQWWLWAVGVVLALMVVVVVLLVIAVVDLQVPTGLLGNPGAGP